MERFLNVLEPVLTMVAVIVALVAAWIARSANAEVAAALDELPNRKEVRDLISEMDTVLEKWYRESAADRMRKKRAAERKVEEEESGSEERPHPPGDLSKEQLWALAHSRGLTRSGGGRVS